MKIFYLGLALDFVYPVPGIYAGYRIYPLLALRLRWT